MMNGKTIQVIVCSVIVHAFKGNFTSNKTVDLHQIVAKKGKNVKLQCLFPVDRWVKEENDFIPLVNCPASGVKINSKYEKKLRVTNECRHLIIGTVNRNDSGIYQCSSNETFKFNVTVTYHPVVKDQNVVFHVGDINKTIICQVDGFPQQYVFEKWKHLSYSFEEIRTLPGSKDGTLFLPYQGGHVISYQDAGFYICNVSNNITDQSGELWQNGILSVSLKGAPFLVRSNDVQRMCLNSTELYMEINVLSVSRLTIAACDKQNHDPQSQDTKLCPKRTVKSKVYGHIIHANSYRCSLRIPVSELHSPYTLTVANSLGMTTAVFTPRLEDGFQMFKNITAGRLYRYRVDVNTTLSHGENSKHQGSFTTEYKLEICRIDSTEISTSTKDAGYNNADVGVMYGVGITGTVSLIIIVILGLLYQLKTVRTGGRNNDAVLESQDVPNVAISNDLYNSIADLNRVPAATGHHNDAHVQNVNHLDESNSHQTHSASNDNNRQIMDNQQDGHTLNYSEVTFDARQKTSKFKVRGAESRTTYADIDICATENLRRKPSKR